MSTGLNTPSHSVKSNDSIFNVVGVRRMMGMSSACVRMYSHGGILESVTNVYTNWATARKSKAKARDQRYHENITSVIGAAIHWRNVISTKPESAMAKVAK